MELRILVAFLLSFASVSGQNFDLTKFPGEACYRNCDGSAPRVCYFKLVFEHYAVLGPACGTCLNVNSSMADCFKSQCVTGDGVERGIMTVNRQMPGPSLHVCENDMIVADVVNMMGGTSTTIHWHGFLMKETPWMDGVPYVTQCPINFDNTFRYQFYARNAGTQWYHSHAGVQKANGIYSGIAVRRPLAKDPNSHTYDFDLKEHMIIITDWMRNAAEDHTVGLRTRQEHLPSNLLINGKGTVISNRQHSTPTPLATFRVKRGFRYRFRMISAMNHICPASIEIENHRLTVIASDSFDFKPMTVDSIVIQPGERYDFVITANQTGTSFWIRFKALALCIPNQTQQVAVLSYAPPDVSDVELAFPARKIPAYETEFGKQVFLNHPATRCFDSRETRSDLCITDLESFESRPDVTDVSPQQQIVLGFHQHPMTINETFGPGKYGSFLNSINDRLTGGAIDSIRMSLPPVPLLTQLSDFDRTQFCNKENLPQHCVDSTDRFCHCTHRYKIKLNTTVELIIVDETPAARQVFHPIHVHGFPLSVVGLGQYDDPRPMTLKRARQLISIKEYTVLKNPVLKDTVSVPSKGFAVYRFKADNPGFWFIHCHYEWHMATGMSLILQVGEPSEMVKPPTNFPKCNNFLNPVPLSAL